ncbi:hypothetical protein GCM10010390_92890 [Streptomyces mordarskii]|uniref:Uncharacterized protein n=1 Tax=Streptomyces mordarskii TaxID=1226758 RepID=A0ABP3PYC8_9ACTN
MVNRTVSAYPPDMGASLSLRRIVTGHILTLGATLLDSASSENWRCGPLGDDPRDAPLADDLDGWLVRRGGEVTGARALAGLVGTHQKGRPEPESRPP